MCNERRETEEKEAHRGPYRDFVKLRQPMMTWGKTRVPISS